MIIDLQKFITEERPYWSELEAVLDRLEKKQEVNLTNPQQETLKYIYNPGTLTPKICTILISIK